MTETRGVASQFALIASNILGFTPGGSDSTIPRYAWLSAGSRWINLANSPRGFQVAANVIPLVLSIKLLYLSHLQTILMIFPGT